MNAPTPETLADDDTLTLLRGGGAVIPTDTVYGIAAHPTRPDAVARIRTIKGRPTPKRMERLVRGLLTQHLPLCLSVAVMS